MRLPLSGICGAVASFAVAAFAVGARAQVQVQVSTLQPLVMHSQFDSGPVSALTVPANTAFVGPYRVHSNNGAGAWGNLGVSVVPTSRGCDLVTGGSLYTGSVFGPGLFAQESGAELIALTSPTVLSGVLRVHIEYDRSSGLGGGDGVVQCDLGNDGSIEVENTGIPIFYPAHTATRQITIGPGQPFCVAVMHDTWLAGTLIGESAFEVSIELLPGSDWFSRYGPACTGTDVIYFENGNVWMGMGTSSVLPDVYVMAVGFSQVSVPMPSAFAGSCPLLTSTDVISGPFFSSTRLFEPSFLLPGQELNVQLIGLNFAQGASMASPGFHVLGN